MTTRPRTAIRILLNPLAWLLVALTDHVTRRCDVANPVAAVRVTLVHLADQNLSGADAYMEITNALADFGFTWPAGWCNFCDTALSDDEADSGGQCAACASDGDLR
ncbi:hypothetical protein [Streptomyces anulatus]|uniref:hypothetical protein n=1 Tax=Streptomyces anulatus TaxID=1892 RepID=UPI001C258C0E|nr:hypothetical protein [Streptomyces anulatus]